MLPGWRREFINTFDIILRFAISRHLENAMGKHMGAPAGIRLSEVLGALSYAMDLTEGQPAGHCIRSCWIGIHVGRAIGLSDAELNNLYYSILLKDLGCSSNAARAIG